MAVHSGYQGRRLCKSRLCICYCFVSFMLLVQSGIGSSLSLSNLLSWAFIGRLGATVGAMFSWCGTAQQCF